MDVGGAKMEDKKLNKKRFIPIIALLLFYLMELNYASYVVVAQHDISYFIIAIIGPLLLLIGMVLATIKLIKQKNR